MRVLNLEASEESLCMLRFFFSPTWEKLPAPPSWECFLGGVEAIGCDQIRLGSASPIP